jgi:hypothetical protein
MEDATSIKNASLGLPQNKSPLTSIITQPASKKWTGESMAEWRERGYVPDSDEEEEDVEKSSSGLQEGSRDEVPSLTEFTEPVAHVSQVSQAHLEAAAQGKQVGLGLIDQVNRHGLGQEIREGQDCVEAARCLSPGRVPPVRWTDGPECLTKAFTPPSPVQVGPSQCRQNLDGFEVVSSQHHRILSTDEREALNRANELPPQQGHESLLPSLVLDQEEAESNHDVHHMGDDDLLPSSSVAKELRATLNLGLQQVDEILRSPERRPRGSQNDSQSSSPLSSLGSLDYKLGDNDPFKDPPSWTSPIHPSEPPGPGMELSAEILAPRRTLRQRTQIQLHPYALEDARYQQELKARGLKPVRIAAVEGQQSRTLPPPARDEASLLSSSPPFEDSAPTSGAGRTQDDTSFDEWPGHDMEANRRDLTMESNDDNDDLPDLASIFRDSGTGTKKMKSRRFRALTGDFVADEREKGLGVLSLPGGEELTQERSFEPATFFVPPSPPRSGSASASDMIPDVVTKEVPNHTPGRLPTPLLSSETRSRKRAVVELSDSSPALSDDGASTDSACTSEEDDEKVGRIKALKRRIKGVLPASWLKLDLKQQTVRDGHHRDPQTANGLIGSKGIAKPITSPRPLNGVAVLTSSSRNGTLQLDFSDEDASSDEGMDVDRAHNHNTRADAPNYLERSTDVLEDNRIDIMQPTRKRRPDSVTKLRKKRQQKISDTWQNVREHSEQEHISSQSHSTRKSRLHKATTTKRQRKFKPAPRLTVLDAPGFVQVSKQDQPRFLKVASRRAKQNARKVTQDPLVKFLKLATDRDTRDINHSLQRWQDSHIQPHHLPQAIAPETQPATDSGPLPLGTINNLNTTHFEKPALTTTSTADNLRALKNITNATVQRILFRKQGLPLHSLREAASIASNSRLPASLARLRIGIGSRKLLQNRAGLGSLQRIATQPRVAQVEHILSDQTTANLPHPPRVSTELSDQVVNPKSSTQLLTGASKHDKKLATTRQQLREQKSGILLVYRKGKGKAPQHTQSIILTEDHQLTSTADSIAALSNTTGSDKISEEAKTVTNVMATLNQEDSSGVASDGWSALWPHLQRWLEVYSDKPSIRTPSEKERAKEIFKVCRELVLRFGWPTALDDIIKKAAWFFSAFDMVDPFDSKINPYIGLPPFLNELNSTVGLALPEPGDSTFYVFLDMLAISLTQKSAEATKTTEELATNKRKKTELQSFVNRLYPNNGQLLSEHEQLRKIHLASLWNRCSLYLTLYCYTPEDCRPRLSHFWNLVDFKKSHMKACEAILTVWGVLACFHAKSKEATQYERLQEMGNWMQSMILAMVSKLVEARQQVENEHPDNVFARGFAEQVLYINHSNVKGFLYEALTTWTMAMGKCENQSSAVQLLNIGQLDILLESVMRIFDRDDWIFQHTLDVIDQYLHKYGTTNLMPGSSAHHVVLLIFQAIHKTLSRRFDADSNYGESDLGRIINRRLTYDWSIVVSALVKVKERSWDDFLEPAGRYSWQRFTDEQLSTQYKTLFVSHIISAEEDVYRDNKFWYLSYWLRAMLRPSHELVFEHELSNAVLKADQYEPVLMNLPLVLQGSSYGYRITLADLKHNRTTAIGRMIENIATASTTYDSQTVDPYALQPSEMADLLSLIMNTMRLTRSNLEQGSKELHEYELMVCQLAEMMERYTSNIVPVQAWLTDTDALAFRYYNLKKRFGGLAPATGRIIISKQEIFWFQNICQKAASQGTPDQISEVLHKVYAEASDVPEIEWYQPKMLAMMEQVFPAYLELALCDNGALMAAPLLRSLDSICQNIFMRAVNMGSEDHSQLLDALYSIILSARIAMQDSRVDRDVATIMLWHVYSEDYRSSFDAEPACTLVLAFKSVVRIARIAILQFHEVVRVAGLPRSELERIAGHTHYIFVFVRALWYCLVDGEEWHWTQLCEADPHHLADDEAEKSRQFTAEALKKHMREDWAKDYYKTWWVTQGRHRVQVRRCGTPTNGLLDVELRDGVKEEMSNFMDMVMVGELEY